MSAGISDADIKAMRVQIQGLAKQYGTTAPDEREKARIYGEIKTFVDAVTNPRSSSSSSSGTILVPSSSGTTLVPGSSPNVPPVESKSITLKPKQITSPASGGDLPKLTGYDTLIGFKESAENHCYLNAALQMFYHVPEFYNFIADATNDKTEGVEPIKRAFAMLEGVIDPGANTSCITGTEQQDAGDYIQKAILDVFIDNDKSALSTFKIKEKKLDLDTTTLTSITADMKDKLTIVLTLNPELDEYNIDDLLHENMISEHQGEQTNSANATGHIFTTYNVIPESNKYLYMVAKRMNFDTDAFNAKDAENKSALENNPTKEVKSYTGAKQDVPIDVKETITVQANPTDRSSKQIEYKMRGFISHGGDTGGGHYTYYWYNNGKWMLFDDSSAKELSGIPSEEMRLGYIYLYERIGDVEGEGEDSEDHRLNTYIVKPDDNDPYYITFDYNSGIRDGWKKQEGKEYWAKPFINEYEDNDLPEPKKVFKDTDENKYLVISEKDIDKKLAEYLAATGSQTPPSSNRSGPLNTSSRRDSNTGYNYEANVSSDDENQNTQSAEFDSSLSANKSVASAAQPSEQSSEGEARPQTRRRPKGNPSEFGSSFNPQPINNSRMISGITGNPEQLVRDESQQLAQSGRDQRRQPNTTRASQKNDDLRRGGNSRRRKSKKRRFQTLKNKKR